MASLIKHRGKYYVQFFDMGRRPQRKQVDPETDTKLLASAWRNSSARKLAGEFDPWNHSPVFESLTVEQAAERFLYSLTTSKD